MGNEKFLEQIEDEIERLKNEIEKIRGSMEQAQKIFVDAKAKHAQLEQEIQAVNAIRQAYTNLKGEKPKEQEPIEEDLQQPPEDYEAEEKA